MKYFSKGVQKFVIAMSVAISRIACAHQGNPASLQLSPDVPEVNGITYDKAFEIAGKFEKIPYGQPIVVTPTQDHEKTGFDLSTFDHLIISVDASEMDSTPNREIP